MSKCKICNKDLYEKISFDNIFKSNYTVHTNCVKNLIINNDREAFPFDEKLIYYDYLFFELNPSFNIDYLEFEYMHILLERNMLNKDWSIIILYEKGLFDRFNFSDKQILFSLSHLAVLIISIQYFRMETVFNENN